MIADSVLARLAGATARAYVGCLRAAWRPAHELEAAIDTRVAVLQSRAGAVEFLDLSTAWQVALGCRSLLQRLGTAGDAAQHRAVQAAIAYFLLDDDGEPDESIVGFDDDLHVLQVTAEVLGWVLPETEA